VTTLNRATWDIEANASPRNPYVVRRERSENEDNLEVVKRSAKIGRSEVYCSKGPLTVSHNKNDGRDLDAASVVLNLEELHPTIFNRDAY
jgi:hypothetical protein